MVKLLPDFWCAETLFWPEQFPQTIGVSTKTADLI